MRTRFTGIVKKGIAGAALALAVSMVGAGCAGPSTVEPSRDARDNADKTQKPDQLTERVNPQECVLIGGIWYCT
jgi:hypothetical protein